MKKSIHLIFIIFLMMFWGLNQTVDARIGTTSSSSSSSRSSSSSSKSPSNSSSSYNRSSSRSRTDSIFSNTAKTNQARDAWQQRNTPVTVPPVTSNPYPSTKNPPSPNPSYRYDPHPSNAATDAIQKQLSDMKTEQRLIGLGQVFSQWFFSKNHNTPNTNTPRPPVTNNPSVINNTGAPNVLSPTPTPNTTTPTPVVPTPATVEKPEPVKKSVEGFPWFKTILFAGLGYWLFSWWKKSVTPVTNYRL